jgi:putative transposase
LFDELKMNYTVKEICFVLGLPRSTYYRWLHKTSTDKEDEVTKRIKEICLKHRQRYGYRKVTHSLKKLGFIVNHKRVLRIMKKENVLYKARKKRKIYIAGKEPIVAPDLIKRDFQAEKPNQKWFTDVTYLQFGEQTLYLSAILDGYNGEIVSYRISQNQTVDLAIETVKQALKKRKMEHVILHSDQGSIYTSKAFQAYTKEKGITMSMSRKGNCHDNARMESFFSYLKSEAFYSENLTNIPNKIVQKIVLEYIHYYNDMRIQEKLNYLSPKEFREKVA